MKFTHHEINPEGKGLERVANIYVATDFDIRAKGISREDFLALVADKEIPEHIKGLIQRVLRAEPSEG